MSEHCFSVPLNCIGITETDTLGISELFTTIILVLYLVEPGSSVSIVSGYGLDDRAIEFRSSAETKDFSSNLCAHPASCTMGTGRGGRGVTLTTHII
jgi:hypothetical protein